jgi:hypothetical protein
MTRKAGLRMTLSPPPIVQDNPPDASYVFRVAGRPACCAAEERGPLVPYHSEDEPPVLCWGCHGYLVGLPGRRLCHCRQPGVVSPAEEDRLRSLEALRDALAATHRARLFNILRPMLEGATNDEARAAWDGLWPFAQKRAARRLAERGLG